MFITRYIKILGFIVCFIISPPAMGQINLPKIHLIAHSSIENREYLYELKCMLEKVFTAQVVLHGAHDIDISSAYMATRQQYKSENILDILAHDKSMGGLVDDGYVFYMIEGDMYGQGYNFLFGLMNFETNINIISMSRLRHKDEGYTTDRIFRLVAKNIAKFGGHKPSGKCFMGFSNGLGELDSREIRLCEPDLSILKSMGIVRKELGNNTIMKGCLLIS